MLAQAAQANGYVDLLIWGGLGVALLGGLWLVWTRSRRWLLENDRPASGGAFSLQELRDMRSRGDLSEEEFETLRQQLVGGYKDMSEEDQSG
jgi:hypothetical protein